MKDLIESPLRYEGLKYEPSWSREGITAALADTHDVLTPTMPNKHNAHYDEWKIKFAKMIPYFEDEVQLVGHSLGAMFLAKYLTESPLATKVSRIILVSGGYDDTTQEELGSFAIESAAGVTESAEEVHLFHSLDDFVVPFSELAKYQADLPDAETHIFSDRGHFLQPDFPELYDLLKQE